MFDEMTNNAHPVALRALEQGAYNENWAESTRPRVLAAVRKAPKIFHVLDKLLPEDIPLDRIEVDYAFERMSGNEETRLKCGLKTKKALYTWWSTYGSFCDVVSGNRSSRSALQNREDDWAELISILQLKDDQQGFLSKFDSLAVSTLIRVCRENDLSCNDLNAPAFLALSSKLKPSTMHTAVNGIKVLDLLNGNQTVPGRYLPSVRANDLGDWHVPANRKVPPLHHDFSALVETYIKQRRTGQTKLLFGITERTMNKDGFGDCRAKNVRVALRWMWHGLVTLGLASEIEFNPSILTQSVLLHDLAACCYVGKLGPICSQQTRRDHVASVQNFLDWITPGLAKEVSPEFWKSSNITKPEEHTPNEKFKRAFCLTYIRSPDQQRAFSNLPSVLFQYARPLISEFRSLGLKGKNGLSVQQHRALDLAIVCMITTINTRFPLRLNTIRQLNIGGLDRHIEFPDMPGSADIVALNISGKIMKNRKTAPEVLLLPDLDYEPRQIFEWYLEDVYPWVLKSKVKYDRCRDVDKLFAGLSTDTLRIMWNRTLPDFGFEITPHMPRHLIASLLKSHGVSIEDIAELLCIKPKVVAEHYAFVDSNSKMGSVMQKHAKIINGHGG
jgi:hypothetical protein